MICYVIRNGILCFNASSNHLLFQRTFPYLGTVDSYLFSTDLLLSRCNVL